MDKFALILIFVVFAAGVTPGCVTKNLNDTKRYQKQVNKLTKKLRKQKRKTQNLRDENIVLRQLAGIPDSAMKRVRAESKQALKVYSEKFLFKQVVKSYNKQDEDKLIRASDLFLAQYPKSKKADNAIYYRGLLELKKSKFAESLMSFDKILERFPKGNKRPGAILGKGLAYMSLNLHNQANFMFSEILKRYPKTPEAVRAKRELREIELKLKSK